MCGGADSFCFIRFHRRMTPRSFSWRSVTKRMGKSIIPPTPHICQPMYTASSEASGSSPYLVAEELRLRAASHEVDDAPAYQQRRAPAEIPQQQRVQRPRHQHHARAEHGQGVYKAPSPRRGLPPLYAQKQKADEKLKKTS